MKLQMYLLILIASLFSSVCHARLGETFEQITNRLGVGPYFGPTNDVVAGVVCYQFQKNGINIGVCFWSGKSVYESYSKVSVNDLNNDPGFRHPPEDSGTEFTQSEIQALFDKNSLGGVWHSQSAAETFGSEEAASMNLPADIRIWYWGNITNPVMLGVSHKHLVKIYTRKYNEARNAAIAAQNDKNLKAF